MTDIGTLLREARERKGVTLRQIADATKLSLGTLQCIERGAFDRLPGGIFTRGYLRAYATEVGVDPDAIVRAYLEQCPAARLPEPAPPAQPRALAELPLGRYVLTAVVVLAVAFVVYTTFRGATDVVPESSLPAPVESVVEPPVAEAVVSGGAPVAEARGGLSLDIRPTGNCWVSVTADGRKVVYRLIREGEQVTVSADTELILRVGNPEAFAYLLNGTPGRPISPSDRPVTIRITEDNFETFLADGVPDVRLAHTGIPT